MDSVRALLAYFPVMMLVIAIEIGRFRQSPPIRVVAAIGFAACTVGLLVTLTLVSDDLLGIPGIALVWSLYATTAVICAALASVVAVVILMLRLWFGNKLI